MTVDEKLAKELSYISKYIGQNEDLVQAGGGNTSVKLDNQFMIIKSSGVHLSEVSSTSGFSVVDYARIKNCLERGGFGDDGKTILEESLISGKRPSIETFLHSITDKYTIHSHPVCVTFLMCCGSGIAALKGMFPDAAFVDYATPGIDLASIFFAAVSKNKKCHVIFLKNHGLVVCANHKDDALKLHDMVISKINEYIKVSNEKDECLRRVYEHLQKRDSSLIAYFVENEKIQSLMRNSTEFRYRYTPDCIVFCGCSLFIASKNDSLEKKLVLFETEYGIPKMMLVNEKFFIVAPSMKKAKEIESVVNFVLKINGLQGDESVSFLDEREMKKILNWDAEKYRQNN